MSAFGGKADIAVASQNGRSSEVVVLCRFSGDFRAELRQRQTFVGQIT